MAPESREKTWSRKDLIGIEGLERWEIELILDTRRSLWRCRSAKAGLRRCRCCRGGSW